MSTARLELVDGAQLVNSGFSDDLSDQFSHNSLLDEAYGNANERMLVSNNANESSSVEGILPAVELPTNEEARIKRDKHGNIVTVSYANGKEVNFEYSDSANKNGYSRLVEVRQPDGHVFKRGDSIKSRWYEVKKGGDKEYMDIDVSVESDGTYRIAHNSGSWNTVGFTDGAKVRYDRNGNVSMYQYPDGSKMRYIYQNGVIVEVVDADGEEWRRFGNGQFRQVDKRGNAVGEPKSGEEFIPPTTEQVLYENQHNGKITELIHALLLRDVEPQVEPNDVLQGKLGDCYFLAPVASIAASDPEAIQDMIRYNSDGTYTITFPGDVEHPVTVQGPTANELDRFAHEEDGMWVCLLEKAHRYYTGRVNSDPGGSSRDALQLLTGKPYERLNFPDGPTTVEELREVLANGLEKGNIVAVTGERTQLIQNHAWSVLSFDEDDDTVTVRNPWGTLGFSPRLVPGCIDLGNGQFVLPADEFLKQFNRLAIPV